MMKSSENWNPPKHIAIIPDGNRRWSRENKFSLMSSYDLGIKKFIDVSVWAKELGVNTISVWALSTENLVNRSKMELNTLFKLYNRASRDPEILDTLNKNNARVRVVGNTKALPKYLRDSLKYLESKSKRNDGLSINVLIGYGGKEDLLYAVKRIVESKSRKIKLTYDAIKESLRTSMLPDIDLIIRTSGEMRLSGLLPWQACYSELYFSKKYWPSFDKNDLKRAISSYSERNRRFGK